MREVETATRVVPILVRGLYKMLRFILPDEEMFLFDVAFFLFWAFFAFPMFGNLVAFVSEAILANVSIFSINLRDYVTYVVIFVSAAFLYRAIFLRNFVPDYRCRVIAQWDRIKEEGELVRVINTSRGKVYLYRLGDSYAIVPESYSISLKDWQVLENFFRENSLSSKEPDHIAEILSSL